MAKTIVPIGPYHPLQEEPEFFTLTIEGEKVVDIDVKVGYNHRGIEKLSEMKTFDQSTFVIERICGICSTSHPFAYTRAVEDIIPVEVPDRAKYIRTIIAEGERIEECNEGDTEIMIEIKGKEVKDSLVFLTKKES